MWIKLSALVAVAIATLAASVGYRVPPCQAEDGGPYPCVWDGPSRGTPGQPGYRQGDRVIILRDD